MKTSEGRPAALTVPVLEWLYARGDLSLASLQALRDMPTRAKARPRVLLPCPYCHMLLGARARRGHISVCREIAVAK